MKMQQDVFYQQLYKAMITESVEDVVHFAYRVWGAPVSICDVEYNILSMQPSGDISDNVWDTLFGSKRVPDDIVVKFVEEGYLTEPSRTDSAVILDWGIIKGHPRAVCRICVDGMVRGFISVLTEKLVWLDEDSFYLEAVAKAAIPAFRKLGNRSMDTHSLHSAFLSYLLEGRIDTETILNRWLVGLKLELKKYFWLVSCAPTLELVASTHMVYVCRKLKIAFDNSPTIIDGNHIYLLLNSNDRHSLRSMLRHPVFEQMRQLKMMFGVSRTYYDILTTPTFRKQADFAIEKGRRSTNEDMVFFYKDYVLDDVFACIAQNIDSENYIHPAIHMLREYDVCQNTEYLKTLKVFICSFCNHSETIQRLAIHRNTLVYRLKQISKISNLDLENKQARLNLLLDFYIDEDLAKL